MSAGDPRTPASQAAPRRPRTNRRPGGGWARTALYLLALVVFAAVVVHPLRQSVVEPKRQALLGRGEPPGRRLALASQFGFDTSAGAGMRMVPGASTLSLADLPTEAATLILGGFRGWYVVWLWQTVEEQKEKKVHFDLIARYMQIAALQSDYPQMWAYHGWNLMYNIPVQWQAPEHKYQWIRRGIEFLTEGYRKNPHNAEIMMELGRGYSEKLGRSQESEYYRRRVKEDEGRSAFLIAYEWFDRARKANDRHDSLGRGLSKPVAYSQACHALSYYSADLTQEAYDAFKASLDARQAGRDAQARQLYDDGLARLAKAVAAWQWTAREWREQALRFEKDNAAMILTDVYKRFYNEARLSADQLQALQKDMTYNALPEVLKKMTRPEIK